MKLRSKLLMFFILSLTAVIGTRAAAGPLDDHYLQAFGELPGSPLQKAVLYAGTSDSPHAECGTPLKHGLQRDWSKLEPATQTVLAKQLAAPVLVNETTYTSLGGHFKIHYSSSFTSPDAPPLADSNPANGVPDWVETVAQTLENVRAAYFTRGYRPAPTVAGAPYDVYLRDLAPQRLYGQTTSGIPQPSAGFVNAYTSYMEMDNDYTDALYVNTAGGPYTATQSMQITAAHEYHHSIQYGYNIFFDIWYAEATSTWYEDELFDTINQLYNYLPAWFGNSTLPLDTAASITTGGGYGRWIFNRYLEEQFLSTSTSFVKASWDYLATLNSSGANADIPMVPVLETLLTTAPFRSTLDSEFTGFARRVYLRDWVSKSGDISRIHTYVPVATLASYPASSLVTLPHYSFAFVKFSPSSQVPTLNLIINRTSGIRTALFKKVGNTITEILPVNGSYSVNGFGSLTLSSDEVVLLVVNGTNLDSHQLSLSTSGTPVTVTEPQPPAQAGGGGGGGGGCFIATAAYGSYLHPQVQVLRDFRDTWLLTNAPGRAFVDFYYRYSPPLADLIARHEPLRLVARTLLAPLILVAGHLVLSSAILLVSASVLCIWRVRRHRRLVVPVT